MTRCPTLPCAFALLAALAAPAPARGAEGLRSENFQTYCAVCHGEDGKAQTEEGRKKKARDFTKKGWLDSVSDDRLIGSVTKGHDKMPAFGKKLTQDEIKALVKEVREIGGKKSS